MAWSLKNMTNVQSKWHNSVCTWMRRNKMTWGCRCRSCAGIIWTCFLHVLKTGVDLQQKRSARFLLTTVMTPSCCLSGLSYLLTLKIWAELNKVEGAGLRLPDPAAPHQRWEWRLVGWSLGDLCCRRQSLVYRWASPADLHSSVDDDTQNK